MDRPFRPVHLIAPYKGLTQRLSGLDELEVMKLDPDQLAKASEPKIKEIVDKMGILELVQTPVYIQFMLALFKQVDEMIEEKNKANKRMEFGR